ncbi:hypothetical protein DFP93_101191 [Aneurinibacillus soli]|uniref:Uncharacterized protein n=1 Tax=Aneurinibacillus soli TaxID=1500254 RepID=A0A0U5C7E1_9BACL|nr:hypothetical protein [Aneurinibacillus soli]PYE64166.1 hypothetical protein DFP93_101191 [Aneurinibacillus soli]BAU28115.1 hypothetical protein CB4_02289 [Aneurinibacillus soli]
MNKRFYFETIVNKKDEAKLKRYIRFIIVLVAIWAIAFVIGVICFIKGITEKDTSSILQIMGFVLMFAPAILLIIFSEFLDPFKKYPVNNRIFILLFLIIERFENLQTHTYFRRFNLLETRVMLNKLTHQFFVVEENMDNAFIFSTILNDERNLLKRVRKIIAEKSYLYEQSEKFPQIDEMLNMLTDLYGYILSKKLFLNSNSQLSDIVEKIDIRNTQTYISLQKIVDQIEEQDGFQISDKKYDWTELFKNKFFQSCILFISCVFIYFVMNVDKNVDAALQKILTIAGVALSILSVGLSKKN